ncbi:outer membrane protein assembly factor BamD [bacterium]|nr:outer membrane protein assembly factor BamD [bacterium]
MKKYLFALMSLSCALFASEEEEFAQVKELYNGKKWSAVVSKSRPLLKRYPESVFLKDMYFYRGVAYYRKGDPDLANRAFSAFLSRSGNSRFTEAAMHYKFFIAKKFEEGHYGHLFGSSKLPRLESMWEEAYQLYDEVILTLPRSEVAAKAMFRKANMQIVDEYFEEGIETYTTLIRRFSNLPIAQEAYINIVKAYKAQIKSDYLDPKCYEFALITKKKFSAAYPNSKWKLMMDEAMIEIVDLFAEDVYKTALYYEKKDKKDAAEMYLRSLLSKYPESKYARFAKERLWDVDVRLTGGSDADEEDLLIGLQ